MHEQCLVSAAAAAAAAAEVAADDNATVWRQQNNLAQWSCGNAPHRNKATEHA